MDGEKGVMLSQRPADGPGVSIGNYKGVMLCNRPLGGGATAPGGGGGGAAKPVADKKPFKAGIRPELFNPRGYDPDLLERKVNAPARAKPVSALAKHKQWLRDLQRQRDELKEQMLLEQMEKEEKRQRFAESQKAIRDAIRGVLDDASEAAQEKDHLRTLLDAKGPPPSETAPPPPAAAPPSAPPAAALPSTGAGAAAPSAPPSARSDAAGLPKDLTDAQKKKLKSRQRPAWAMTEEAAADAADAEADELLNFVASLDFESFVDDIEVRAALEAARERIAALSARDSAASGDDGDDDNKLGDDDDDAPRRVGTLSEASLKQHDARTGGRVRKADDTMSLADTVMSSASTISQVHSKKSLQAVIDRTKAKMEAMATIPEADAPPPALPPVPAPKIVVSDPVRPAMEKKKNLVANLPYQHRNPAV